MNDASNDDSEYRNLGLLFALAILFGWFFYLNLWDVQCSVQAPTPCSFADLERRTVGPPILLGAAVLFLGLGCA